MQQNATAAGTLPEPRRGTLQRFSKSLTGLAVVCGVERRVQGGRGGEQE